MALFYIFMVNHKPFSIILILALTILAACNTDFEPYSNSQCGAQVALCTDNNLIDLASQIYQEFYPSKSKGAVSFNHILRVFGRPCTRSSSVDTHLYIINASDNNGFVILGNAKDQFSLLGVSDYGHIDDMGNIDNPGMALFIHNAIDYVTIVNENNENSILPLDLINPIRRFWTDTLTYDVVSPRCPYQWGQSYPAGYYCPNGLCGCGPLSAALAASFLTPSDTIYLNYPDHDIDYFRPLWAFMKSYNWANVEQITPGSNSLQGLSANDIAHLCRELGYQSHANYYITNPPITTVTASNLRNGVQHLFPSITISNLTHNAPVAKNVLNDGVIITLGSINGTNGHVWVIDGYINSHIRVYSRSYDPNTQEYSDTTYVDIIRDMQHINWGWYGQCNGYFANGVFKCDNAQSYDFDNLNNNSTNNYNDIYYFTMSN